MLSGSATVISPPHSEDRTDPQKLFEHESEQLQLGFQLKSLIEPFVPGTGTHV